MALSWVERDISGKFYKELDKARWERLYTVVGTTDPMLAMTCGPAIGDAYGDLIVVSKECTVGDDRNNTCILKIIYEKDEAPSETPPASQIEFDTMAQATRVTKARAQLSYPVAGFAPGLLIGQQEPGGKPEGADIYLPGYTHTETHYRADCTYAYRQKLYQMTGSINKYPWKEFAIGEALFLGANGRQISDERWEVTYRFAGEGNQLLSITLLDGTVVGPFTKRGWDYIWYRTGAKPVGSQLQWGIVSIHLAEVYKWWDFSELGIGV